MSRIFYVEECHAFHNHGYANLVGERVVTTDDYSELNRDHQPLLGTVIGVTTSKHYEVSSALRLQGYTQHQVYTIQFDDGRETVVWPNEVKPLRLQIVSTDK